MHVSEVSWDLVQDVRDILTDGDAVRVKVITVDRLVHGIYLPHFHLVFYLNYLKAMK